jgi:hypothetical protein
VKYKSAGDDTATGVASAMALVFVRDRRDDIEAPMLG